VISGSLIEHNEGGGVVVAAAGTTFIFDSMLINNAHDDVHRLDAQATLLLSNNVIGLQT